LSITQPYGIGFGKKIDSKSRRMGLKELIIPPNIWFSNKVFNLAYDELVIAGRVPSKQ